MYVCDMRRITYNNGYSSATVEARTGGAATATAAAAAAAAAAVSAGAALSEDVNLLGLPMRAAIAGFQEAKRAFENGTDEVRRLLLHECSFIYECNVCRNLFRCLGNFISHKQAFCRDPGAVLANGHTDPNAVPVVGEGTSAIQQTDAQVQSVASVAEVAVAATPAVQVPASADGCVQEVAKDVVAVSATNSAGQNTRTSTTAALQLERIPNSIQPVQQTFKRERADSIKMEVDELTKMLSNIGTTLGPDGKEFESGGDTREHQEAPATDEDSGGNTTCDICNAAFQTDQALQLHKQNKHASSTFVFQCPACTQTFLQPSAVVRHLANEHKKPVRHKHIRDSILRRRVQLGEAAQQQSKGAASRELKRLQSSAEDGGSSAAELNVHEVKKVMSPCIYCEKSFERRAALSTHLLNCRAKQVALERPHHGATAKHLKVQEEENESANASIPLHELKKEVDALEETMEEEESLHGMFANLNADQTVTSVGETVSGLHTNGLNKPEMMQREKQDNGGTTEERPMEEQVQVVTDAEVQSAPVESDKEKVEPCESSVKKLTNGESMKRKSLSKKQADGGGGSSNSKSKKKRRFQLVASEKSLSCRCKICNKQFNALSNLRRHISMFHYRARRFGCKLCDYRGFRRYDIVNHLGFVHKMTGEREAMSTEYVSVHEVHYSKDDVDGDIVLLTDEQEGVVSEGVAAAAAVGSTSAADPQPVKTYEKRSKRNKAAGAQLNISAPARLLNVTPEQETRVQSMRQGLRRSHSHQDDSQGGGGSGGGGGGAGGGAKRPIRNRIKTVNKDFVYDLSSLLKKDPAATSVNEATTRNLRRRNMLLSVAELGDCSNSSSNSIVGEPLAPEPLVVVAKQRAALNGAARRIALGLVGQGRAVSSTPPEIPAERPQMRPRLSSSCRDDMQAGPVIDTSDLEAARLKASTLLDDSFLEKIAKRSAPGFRMKPCLVSQHSALDTLLQKVDSSLALALQQSNVNASALSPAIVPVATPPPSEEDQRNHEEHEQHEQATVVHRDPLEQQPQQDQNPDQDQEETILPTSFAPQLPESPTVPFSYQTSLFLSASDPPDSPTIATVSDFEDDSDDDSGGVIGSLLYPPASGKFYVVEPEETIPKRPTSPLPTKGLALMQRLAARPAGKHGDSMLRSALEH